MEDEELYYFATVINLTFTLDKSAVEEVARAVSRLNYYLPVGVFALGGAVRDDGAGGDEGLHSPLLGRQGRMDVSSAGTHGQGAADKCFGRAAVAVV